MQKILRYAYDIVLFTIYSYFSFVEAVNLEQTANEMKWLVSRHIFFGEARGRDFIIHYFGKFHYSQNFHYLWSYVALLPEYICTAFYMPKICA